MEVIQIKVAFPLTVLTALLSLTVAAQDIVIAHVDLISMLEPGVQTDRNVTVRGAKIVAIGRGEVARGARVIDGDGRFLIPGLAEMHAHVPVDPAYRDDVLFLWVANGVTTARGMLGHPTHLSLRDDLLAHRALGPRLITSGPSFSGQSVSTAADAAKRVRAQKDAGYDFLKIHPGLTADEFDAIAAAARDVGMTFAGHVTASVGLRAAFEAGQTTIDHLDGYMNVITPDIQTHADAAASFFGAALTPYVDRSLIAQAVAMTKTFGGAVVPTQTLLENTANAHRWQTMADRPQFNYLPKRLRAGYVERMKRTAAVTNPELGAKFLRIREDLIKALHDGGVPVLLGSDSPQIFNVPGFATHRELESMVAAGLTPFEALATGTTAPAAFFGTTDWGAIAVGRDADLVLLSGNPLDDIANTQRIEGVMVRGRWLDRAEIDAGLQQIQARYR